jgi:hypothetical protein
LLLLGLCLDRSPEFQEIAHTEVLLLDLIFFGADGLEFALFLDLGELLLEVENLGVHGHFSQFFCVFLFGFFPVHGVDGRFPRSGGLAASSIVLDLKWVLLFLHRQLPALDLHNKFIGFFLIKKHLDLTNSSAKISPIDIESRDLPKTHHI